MGQTAVRLAATATLLSVALAVAAAPARAAVVLDEGCLWRRYYRFGVSRCSPEAMKADAPRLLGPRGLSRCRRNTERWLSAHGVNPRGVDWRDHVFVSLLGARAFNPSPTPPPPADWAAAAFDDRSWVRRTGPCQAGSAHEVLNPILGQYGESVDLRLRGACYRARFGVDDPRAAGTLTLRATYTGGARAFVNGQEVARGHLPAGDLAADARASDYPAAAYGPTGARLRDRVLGPVAIAPRLLRKGVNVLALEVRASDFHPVVLTNPTHVAVALRYDAKEADAPILVAKGADHVAEKIREVARAYGVPIVRRPELARAIFASVKLNTAIPETLYVAVAEVLAMIYRLRHRR